MATVSTSKAIRLINLGKVESWQTQAVYHALAERMTEESPDTIIICQPDKPYLSLGHFQPFDSIFDRSEVERLNLPIFTRRIGGGATYLDKNQLFYQFIFHHSRVPVLLEKAYNTFLAAPVETLKSFGLDCKLRALNEIEVNGKRIAGIGGGRIGNAAVVVGNYLFDFDFDVMSSVWKSPSSGFKELASEAVKERIYILKHCIPALSIDDVTERLIEILPRHFNRPITMGKLSSDEYEVSNKESEKLMVKYSKNQNYKSETIGRPLKISADVFIHSKKIGKNGKSSFISFRTDKEIVTRVKIENANLEFLEKSLIDKHIDDANRIIKELN